MKEWKEKAVEVTGRVLSLELSLEHRSSADSWSQQGVLFVDMRCD